MQLRTIFEDSNLIAISKPAGLKVHGAAGEETVESLASDLCGCRAILLHRLDRDTTGLVLLAKRKEVAGPMSRMFEKGLIRKAYFAIVHGRWRAEWNRVESVIESDVEGRSFSKPLGEGSKTGKRSLTTFRILDEFTGPTGKMTWLEALPKTGRKHQIRVHCESYGCAVVGDPLYGAKEENHGGPMYLHAYRVDFKHPMTGEPLRLLDLPPEAWRPVLGRFQSQKVFEKLYR